MKALNEFMMILSFLRYQEHIDQFYQEDLRGLTKCYPGEYGKPRKLRFINTKGEHLIGRFTWFWTGREIVVQRVQGTSSKPIKPGKIVRPVEVSMVYRNLFEVILDFLKPREYRMVYTRCI